MEAIIIFIMIGVIVTYLKLNYDSMLGIYVILAVLWGLHAGVVHGIGAFFIMLGGSFIRNLINEVRT